MSRDKGETSVSPESSSQHGPIMFLQLGCSEFSPHDNCLLAFILLVRALENL